MTGVPADLAVIFDDDATLGAWGPVPRAAAAQEHAAARKRKSRCGSGFTSCRGRARSRRPGRRPWRSAWAPRPARPGWAAPWPRWSLPGKPAAAPAGGCPATGALPCAGKRRERHRGTGGRHPARPCTRRTPKPRRPTDSSPPRREPVQPGTGPVTITPGSDALKHLALTRYPGLAAELCRLMSADQEPQTPPADRRFTALDGVPARDDPGLTVLMEAVRRLPRDRADTTIESTLRCALGYQRTGNPSS